MVFSMASGKQDLNPDVEVVVRRVASFRRAICRDTDSKKQVLEVLGRLQEQEGTGHRSSRRGVEGEEGEGGYQKAEQPARTCRAFTGIVEHPGGRDRKRLDHKGLPARRS